MSALSDRPPGKLRSGAPLPTSNTPFSTSRTDEDSRPAPYFDVAFNHAPIGIALLGADGGWIRLNPSVCKTVGYAESELMQLSIREITHEEDRDTDIELRNQLLRGEISSYEIEKRLIHKEGYSVWVLLSVSAVADEAGDVSRLISQIVDITERKQTEADLRKSEAQMRLLHHVTTNRTASFQERLSEALQITTDLLNLDIGLLSHIEGDVYTVFASSSEALDPGTTFELGQTYCSITYEANDVVAIDHMAVSEHSRHPCYEAFKLESYLGIPIEIDGERFGTLNVSGASPSNPSFTENDREFLRVLAQWVAAELVRHRTELELRAREAQLDEAERTAHLGSFEWNVVDDELSWSQEMYRLFGIDGNETIDFARWTDVIHPLDRDRIRQVMRESIEEKIPYSAEYRVVLPDGAVRVLQSDSSVTMDDEDNLMRINGTALDVTETWQAQQAAESSRALVSGVVESSLDGVMVFESIRDESGKIVDFEWLLTNPMAAEITGRSIHELIGKRLLTEMPGNRDSGLFDEYVRVVETGEPTRSEFFYDQDQITAWFETVAVKLDDGFTVTFRDISRAKETEEYLKNAHEVAVDSARLKSEFLANMSHEIRTPMNGVIGMTDMLSDTSMDDEQREYVKIIRSSGEALLRLINDILDFSKIEAGKLDIDAIDFDLNDPLDETLQLLSERANSNGVALGASIESSVPTLVHGDPARLRQVLINLVGNAIKFAADGHVLINIDVAESSGEAAMLRFEITDTGIGISDEAQKLLFQPFRQADGSTTRKYGGTGLGLAISRQLVELMGGEIGVESTLGVGSTFWFTVDLQLQNRNDTEYPDISSLCVLVADEHENCRVLLEKQIRDRGATALGASSGAEALEILRSGATAVDLVIAATNLPGLSGYDIAKLVENDPKLESVDVVLMPPFGSRPESGAATILQKPVAPSKLLALLAKRTSAGKLTSRDHSHDLDAPRESPVGSTPVTPKNTEPSYPSDKPKILVVEDNPANQAVALGYLKRLGYPADSANNGLEAIEAYQKTKYAIVLMDCQMPEMDGFDATAELRRLEAGNPNTVVIAVTANAMRGDREKCLRAGMDDFISKPFRIEALQSKIEHWLERAKLENAR